MLFKKHNQVSYFDICKQNQANKAKIMGRPDGDVERFNNSE